MSSRIDPNDLKKVFLRGFVVDSDTTLLYNVCDLVYSVHFSHNFDAYDDLVQEGVLGIIRLVDEGNYDETKGDVLTFVYTRVRNCMSNFLYHEIKEVSRNVGEDPLKNLGSEMESGWLGFVSEELIRDILDFVNSKIEELGICGDLSYYVRGYFMDKLGVRYIVGAPKEYSLDVVEKYRYYVNSIEHGVFLKFINPNVFENKIKDIIDVLESEGEVGFFMRMFLDSLSEEQLIRLMYVFSTNSFQFPSKFKLLKTDSYLSVYRRVRHGKMSVEDASKLFDKPLSTILSIIEKYDIIFN